MNFSLFPPGFPHPVESQPIHGVMEAAVFWKFLGKNVGILPFIKKKGEGFSFIFTVCSGIRLCIFPNWNLPGGSFPQAAGVKTTLWKSG